MNEAYDIDLASLLEGIVAIAAGDVRITDLTLDSRAVRPGSLFFALAGTRQHGLAYLDEAVRRGVRAILWETAPGIEPPVAREDVLMLAVPKLSAMVGRIADRFFGRPSAHLRVVGITGTNGKTTCAWLVATALERLNRSAEYLGTLGAGVPGSLRGGSHTTPDAVQVHRECAAMRARGTRFVAMEVSSHALAQNRVSGLRFAVAAFTNLTRDHLDYHGSMQEYGEAKAQLFLREATGRRVINVGDAFGLVLSQRLADREGLTVVWAGAKPAVSGSMRAVYATAVHSEAEGLRVEFDGAGGRGTFRSPLIGRFNAENLLLALGILLALDVPMAEAVTALSRCTAPPGRMQCVDGGGNRPLAVIDYAHTPDALAKALAAVREHCRGRIWCVFGCGGDRDAGKRPLMGAVADELADRIVLTDDNPRSEAPAAITAAIAAAVRRHEVRIIHDRREAIRSALSSASAGDLVLIAGKGHEDYQIYGERRVPFSDQLEVQRHFGMAA
ncbi:MAG: UDP-N-acetylmuramoyl-L-alanyl-D-glutamate--2,6-diaminopimelate ligase [Proteobacteria bacterium]|nr:UDP-N-acetylmuramoyl-L-alanyl-D-glutamate--2,6-diaminopimelate ligase [Pseudomonadota bacterium]